MGASRTRSASYAGVRTVGPAGLWLAYVIVAFYSIVYLGVLDRMGLHFYPMFTPRSPLCVVAYATLFGIYYALFEACNSIVAGRGLHR